MEMPEFVEYSIRHLPDSDSHDSVGLLVGCSGDRDELKRDVCSLDTERVDEVGRKTLLVELPASEAGEIWELDSIESIEPNDTGVETQGSS
ncbi:hypothetical protein [Halobaculum sp. MBLA0143]|uniref:hypothetical protein n=1 Tax=Halobaculum sp. MBLA0143 TaxID=3079933 RepID=UPI0035249F7C